VGGNRRKRVNLNFVDGEEGGGGGAGSLGDGTAAEEMDESLVQADDITVLRMPATGGEGVAVEAALEAADGVETLGFQGGGNRNDLDLLPGEKAQEVGLDVSESLVLAGLAGKDNYKSKTLAIENAFEDGVGDLLLVGAEGNTDGVAGEVPWGGGEAADATDTG